MDLYEGRRLTYRIRRIQDHIDVLRAKAEFTAPKLSHTAGCGGFRFDSKIENYMAEIDELENQKTQLIAERAAIRTQLLQEINVRASSEQQALVLYLYFVEERSNRKIAASLGVSVRHIMRIKQDIV